MGEREAMKDWTWWVEDAYLLCTPENPECLKFHYFPKPEDVKHPLTPDEEIEKMNEQINASEGFDIDFSMFRCLFNYHLVDPDDYDFLDEVTNGNLMIMLCYESLKIYTRQCGKQCVFVNVVKTNFHFSCGYMFLITFNVLDLSDNKEKPFQARVRFSSTHPTEYVFCRPKPDPNNDDSDEISEEDDSDETPTSEEDVKVDSNGTSTSEEDVKD